MQNISNHFPSSVTQGRGGRVGSARHRHAQELCEEFTGLEQDTNRYDLLLLVKKTGQSAGFSSKMIHLLDYYMAFTRELDWEEGARPIVFQSIAKTALDLGVSERHVQRLEQALFEAGALTWNDSGNHRRFGQRDDKGRILYAYGVDLSPLAALKPVLQAKLDEKTLHDQAWLETKRQISWHRRQINALLAEAGGGEPEPFLVAPIRTYLTLAHLRGLLEEHRRRYEALLAEAKENSSEEPQTMPLSGKESSPDDRDVVHYKSTTQESSSEKSRPKASCLQESVAAPPEPVGQDGAGGAESREGVISSTGLQHISVKQALNAASERFRDLIPLEPRALNWPDLVEAAYRLRPELKISQRSWGEACLTLGRNGAAVCLLLTDQAMQRDDDPVRKPGAYFHAMIHRARSGELHLHASVFGLLKRGEGVQI